MAKEPKATFYTQSCVEGRTRSSARVLVATWWFNGRERSSVNAHCRRGSVRQQGTMQLPCSICNSSSVNSFKTVWKHFCLHLISNCTLHFHCCMHRICVGWKHCISFWGPKNQSFRSKSGKQPIRTRFSIHVYVDRSRDDNVQGILGAIGPCWPKWGAGASPEEPEFFEFFVW